MCLLFCHFASLCLPPRQPWEFDPQQIFLSTHEVVEFYGFAAPLRISPFIDNLVSLWSKVIAIFVLSGIWGFWLMTDLVNNFRHSFAWVIGYEMLYIRTERYLLLFKPYLFLCMCEYSREGQRVTYGTVVFSSRRGNKFLYLLNFTGPLMFCFCFYWSC